MALARAMPRSRVEAPAAARAMLEGRRGRRAGGGGGGGSAEVRGEVEKGWWRWIGGLKRGVARTRHLGFIIAATLERLILKLCLDD